MKTERNDLLEKIYAGVFRGSGWQKLDPVKKKKLRRKWDPHMSKYSTAELRAFASPNPGTPSVYTNGNLDLLISFEGKGRIQGGGDPLRQLIGIANHHGELVHGHDDKLRVISTEMSQLNRHCVVIGESGTGKSTYLANYALQLAQQGGPMIIMEPHGALIEDVVASLDAKNLERVVYIDPADYTEGIGWNLLQFARNLIDDEDPDFVQKMTYMIEDAVENIVYALSVIQEDDSGYSAGPSIQSILKMVASAASEREDTNFVDVYNLVTNKELAARVGNTVQQEHVQSFFRDTFIDLGAEYRERVRNKLDPFLSQVMVNMFSRRDGCTPLQDLLAQNKIIMVDLNQRKMSRKLSQLIGYIMFTMLMFVVDKRETKNALPMHFIIDEASNFASQSTTRWIAEARKKDASLTLGFQNFSQVSEEVRAALAGVGTWIVYRVNEEDARPLCSKMGLVNHMNQPLVQELTMMPLFEAKIFTDEFENQLAISGRAPTKTRALMQFRGLPPPPKRTNYVQIKEAVRKRSMRLYAKPHDPTDRETVYAKEETGTMPVLMSIFEANAAARNAQAYYLPPGHNAESHRKAAGALNAGTVNVALIQNILDAKGITFTGKRLGQLMNNLRLRRFIDTRALESGFTTHIMTRAGTQTILEYLVPNESQNEGGPVHKQAILATYQALAQISPMDVQVPAQESSDYLPDMTVRVPGGHAPKAWPNRLTKASSLHLLIEDAGRTRPDHMVTSMAHAFTQDAMPIIVLPAFHEEDLAAYMGSVASKIRGVKDHGQNYATITAIIDPDDLARRPYRLWCIDGQNRLWEYDEELGLALPVVDVYAKGTRRPGRPTTRTEIAPPPMVAADVFVEQFNTLLRKSPDASVPRQELLSATGVEEAELDRRVRKEFHMRRVRDEDGDRYVLL